TALVILALLNTGVPATDPNLSRGLAYLRGVESSTTYVRSLQAMVYAESSTFPGLAADRERLKENVDWLLRARIGGDRKRQGWTYGQNQAGNPDNSNTQYALLGLYAGKSAGIAIPASVW